MNERRERVVDCGKAVLFLVVCGDEILLQKRTDNEKGFVGEVIIPGGRGEPGEDHFETVIREAREEAGLEEVVPIPLGDSFKVITDSAHLYLMRAYLIEVNSKEEVTNTSPIEGEQVWASFEEAKKLEWSHSQLALERAEKYLMEERSKD